VFRGRSDVLAGLCVGLELLAEDEEIGGPEDSDDSGDGERDVENVVGYFRSIRPTSATPTSPHSRTPSPRTNSTT